MKLPQLRTFFQRNTEISSMLRFHSSSFYHSLYFKGIHGFPRILQYSTSSSTVTDQSPCLANYLVSSLGFSNQQALSTSAKLSHLRLGRVANVNDFNFSGNADSIIEFLEQNGLTQSQIRKVVCSKPQVLLANVEKTLKPKFRVLQSLGLSRSDLAQVISVNPTVLFYRLDPGIQALRRVLGCDENVVRIMKRSRIFSFRDADKYLINNIGLLESYGIPTDKIKKGILLQARPYALRTELFRDIVKKVEEQWEISRDSAMFLYGIQLLGCCNEKNISAKFKIFESFGWSEKEIKAIVRQNPNCLGLSEARIKKSLDFLMNEVGYQPGLLASFSCLLTYSVEKRLKPRRLALQALKEKGLLRGDYPLYSAVCMSETKFLKRFVEPYKDDVSDLYDVYVKSRDSPVPVLLPTQGIEASHLQ